MESLPPEYLGKFSDRNRYDLLSVRKVLEGMEKAED
jgi:hypothetical protein